MKKIKFCVLAIAALALGACTSDDVVVSENVATPVIGGDGYISLAVNLPTQNSTRAANDVYDDGLPSEYAVHDAYLLLFAGDDESTATLYDTYTLSTGFEMEPDNDNITSRSQIIQEISTPSDGSSIYALVVLNANNLLDANFTTGKTLAQLQSTSVSLGGVSAMTSDGFYMCNAPLINATGTAAANGAEVTTLALIDPDKIYHTEELAAENPAAEIYVERGMAKVTVNADDSYTSAIDGVTVTVNGFALDQTNNVSYLVRNTTTDSAEDSESWWGMYNATPDATRVNYRFPGSTVVDNNGLYRTYWAVDPNYDVAPVIGTDMSSIVGASSVSYGALGDDHPQYCLENTFNVRHQNDDETTRAIIQATFDTDGDFYIWDKNHSVLYGYEDIQNLILRALEGNEAIEEALLIYADENVDFYSHFTVSLAEATDGTLTEASDDAEIVITITTPFTEDEFMDPDTHYTPYDVPTVCTQDGLDVVVEALNDVHTIGAYAGGVSYYSVLIKHFGDDLTPWSDDYMDASATTENERSYPESVGGQSANANWLGRYGVLRNNWYDVTINSILEPGSATPPEATGKPDDPTDLYISIEINILSWAKRTQSVDL